MESGPPKVIFLGDEWEFAQARCRPHYCYIRVRTL